MENSLEKLPSRGFESPGYGFDVTTLCKILVTTGQIWWAYPNSSINIFLSNQNFKFKKL